MSRNEIHGVRNFARVGALLITLSCVTLRTARTVDAAQTATAHPPTKWALLVGINNYKYPDMISPLAGSVNDVEDMREVLIGKFEFPPENIMVLTNAQATHSAIIDAIRTHLIAKVQAGDIALFQYSGHGAQSADKSGEMISALDGTIVPYDSRDPAGKVFDISGAELHPLLLQLAAKTSHVTFILDSCHSGTMVRGARVRGIAADSRPQPPSVTRELSPSATEAAPKFVTIAAATSKESAFEHFEDEKEHGAMTCFLTRQLPVDAENGNNKDWISADDITRDVKAIHSLHVLIISDSCYSGTLTRDADVGITLLDKQRVLVRMLQSKSRTLLASGGNEPVACRATFVTADSGDG